MKQKRNIPIGPIVGICVAVVTATTVLATNYCPPNGAAPGPQVAQNQCPAPNCNYAYFDDTDWSFGLCDTSYSGFSCNDTFGQFTLDEYPGTCNGSQCILGSLQQGTYTGDASEDGICP